METTEKRVEQMIAAILGPERSPRQTYQLRELLRGLVRQAKVEQIAEMRRDVGLAIGPAPSVADKRKSKAECKKLLGTCQSKQASIKFE